MKCMLFVTWDGPQVNYLEGLFFPILQGLTDQYHIHVLQFTWGDPEKSEQSRVLFASAGMTYTRFTVSRKPFVLTGTGFAVLTGAGYLRRYLRSKHIDVVLARSTFPALMALLQRRGGTKWVFDADGLPLEERVDFFGLRRDGLAFKFLKAVEKSMVRRAAVVLVRTAAAIPYLGAEASTVSKFHVVGNGRDPAIFKPLREDERIALRKDLGIEQGEILLVYAGSLGPQYCLPEMFILLERMAALDLNPRLLILTGSPEWIDRAAPDAAVRSRMLVRTLPSTEVPRYLGAADAGLAIRDAAPSMKGVAPIKIGEYLLCGLPVVVSGGIGDTESQLKGREACMVLPDRTPEALEAAGRWISKVAGKTGTRAAAREAGLALFSLEQSIRLYKTALAGLDGKDD